MLRYILQRILAIVILIFFSSLITFVLGYYGPGDPVEYIMHQAGGLDPEVYRIARQAMGLDDPLWTQYARATWAVCCRVTGARQLSWVRRPCFPIFSARLPISAQLGLVALVILIVIGIPMGILSAVKQNSWVDHLLVTFSILGASVPSFVLAPLLMILIVVQLKLIPEIGYGFKGIFSATTVLPAFILAVGPLLVVVRQTRAGVLEVLSKDYIRTAKAKGLPQLLLVERHIVKNALTPVLTTLGLITGGLLTGSLFVETIFSIPGFGRMVVMGLRAKDIPLLMGTTLIGATIVMVANLFTDLLYMILDPRVRVE